VQRSRIRGDTSSLPQYAFMAWFSVKVRKKFALPYLMFIWSHTIYRIVIVTASAMRINEKHEKKVLYNYNQFREKSPP